MAFKRFSAGSKSEFQRTLPEYYARLEKFNHRDWYIGRDWFKEHLAARDSGTFPDIIVWGSELPC